MCKTSFQSINILLLVPICIWSQMGFAQNFQQGFHFNLPADDATDQRFLPKFEAATIEEFITIDTDGHFSVGGEPIRFWGVNLTTNACFPVKEKSPFIAARMRKMGINLVRFHHMDNGWSGNEGTIFIRGTGNTRELDPQALDRLFFLLSEMKKNAVYANINLHVSRTFLEGDGVENADSIWNFAKGVTYFDPQLILLQKEFAQNLLTAENPYTGLTLAEDPVIAMVEITNENTLYGMWKGDQLKAFAQGGDLMRRHADLLTDQWNEFLLDKYGEHAALEQAWKSTTLPIEEMNQMIDGDFEANDIGAQWDLELHSTAAATVEVSTNALSGEYAAKVTVDRVTGTAWHIQFQQDGLTMQQDSSYVLEFYARADRPRAINAALQKDIDPWTWYGGQNFDLTTSWQKFRLSVTAIEDNNGQVRATFNFANEPGTVWFDNIAFFKPVPIGLEEGESLPMGNLRRVDFSERAAFHPQRVADLAQFYLQVERSFYREMYRFLKSDLGVRVPITGTNALVGPADVYMQQDLDYIDDHAYWNHPRFPGEPWSATDWFIDNETLLDHDRMGTVSDLFGGLALDGKPYTISEYNHPFPNRYQYEMFPVLASHASYHDADGLMFFQYHGGSNEQWEEDFISGFFGIHRNHSLMSMSPIFGYAYRLGLINTAIDRKVIQYDSISLFRMALDDNFGRWGTYYPYDQLASASATLRTGGFDAAEMSIPDLSIPTGPVFISGTSQLHWNVNTAVHTIDAPHLQCFTGALASLRDEGLESMTLHQCSDEGVISWLSLDDLPLTSSGLSLLSIHSRIQNSGMVWEGDRTVRDQWGSAPTEIQALRAVVSLKLTADSMHVYPLDEIGAEAEFFTVWPDADGHFLIEIDQQEYPTPWFGIEAFGVTTPVRDDEGSFGSLQIWPNPTESHLNVRWEGLSTPEQVTVINGLGQILRHESLPEGIPGSMSIPTPGLAPGVYFLQLHTPKGIMQRKFVRH